MRRFVAVALSMLLTAALQCASATAQESPSDAYVSALRIMQALPEPPYATFESNFQAPAMHINLAAWQGYATLYLLLNKDVVSNVSWRTEYHADAHLTTLRTANGTQLVALSPIFDPTWSGAYDWLRYGLQGAPAPASASAQQNPTGLRTIALVTAISPGAYDVDDAGAAQCPSGSPARHLHLRARFAPEDHPLTDVIIDQTTNRFCSMRFTIGSSGLVYTMIGFMELHFGQVGKYWLVTGGNGNIAMQFFGQTYKESPITFNYSGVAFQPTKKALPRPPVFTAALFKHPASSRAAAPSPQAVVVANMASAAAPQPPIKTIVHVYAQQLCVTLRQNVARAIQGLRTNDAIFAQSNNAVADIGTALANTSHFSDIGRATNSSADYAGKNDIDPAVAMNQVKLMHLLAQVQHNLEEIQAALADSKRFPSPPVTNQDRTAANIKAYLEALAKQQEALLNALSGLAQTTEMQQLLARGDGTLGTTNDPAARPGHATPMVSMDDTALTYGDPLDSTDPSTRRADPSIAGGRRGGPNPMQSQAPQNTQVPAHMANNPLAPFFAASLQNEQSTHQAEDALAARVKTAVVSCP